MFGFTTQWFAAFARNLGLCGLHRAEPDDEHGFRERYFLIRRVLRRSRINRSSSARRVAFVKDFDTGSKVKGMQ